MTTYKKNIDVTNSQPPETDCDDYEDYYGFSPSKVFSVYCKARDDAKRFKKMSHEDVAKFVEMKYRMRANHAIKVEYSDPYGEQKTFETPANFAMITHKHANFLRKYG